MNSGAGDTTQLVPGSPIRTPWDHSSVDSSPRPIAASHVLHRLLVPRHPPCALSNLTTKMLASTVQFSTNTRTPPHPATTTHTTSKNLPQRPDRGGRFVARRGRGTRNNNPTPYRGDPHPGDTPTAGLDGLFLQDPTGCPSPPTSRTTHTVPPRETPGVLDEWPLPADDSASVSAVEHPTPPTQPPTTNSADRRGGGGL